MLGLGLHFQILLLVILLGSVGGMIALVRFVGDSPMNVKRFAVGFAIAVLLPLSVHYGAELVRNSPSEEIHYERLRTLETERSSTKDPKLKKSIAAEEQRLKAVHREEKKQHGKVLFLVGYPIAIAAIVFGVLLRVQHVGAGFLFGGIFTLTDACYGYWEIMADWLRFGSLVGALLILAVLGYWKLGRDSPARPDPATE